MSAPSTSSSTRPLHSSRGASSLWYSSAPSPSSDAFSRSGRSLVTPNHPDPATPPAATNCLSLSRGERVMTSVTFGAFAGRHAPSSTNPTANHVCRWKKDSRDFGTRETMGVRQPKEDQQCQQCAGQHAHGDRRECQRATHDTETEPAIQRPPRGPVDRHPQADTTITNANGQRSGRNSLGRCPASRLVVVRFNYAPKHDFSLTLHVPPLHSAPDRRDCSGSASLSGGQSG